MSTSIKSVIALVLQHTHFKLFTLYIVLDVESSFVANLAALGTTPIFCC